MFPFGRVGLAAAALVVTACGADRSVNPMVEKYDGSLGAGALATEITGEYRLTIGQRVTIRPKTTSRTSRMRWSTTNSQVASVSSQGTVTGAGAGTATVTVSGAGRVENYTVAVAATAPAPTVTGFALQPAATVSLLPGGTQQFGVSATWSDGGQYPLTVTYSATGGTISGGGLYTAGSTAGRFAVIAACLCGLADTTFVDVAQLTRLTILPDSARLEPGAAFSFNFTANWSTGATERPPVTWSVDPAGSGSISQGGAYVAPTVPGSFRVIVAHTGGTVRDTAFITVNGAAPPPPPPPTPSGAACPNQPAGYTLHSDLTFASTAIPTNWNLWGDRILRSNGPAAATSLGFRQRAGTNSGQIGILESNAGAGVRKIYTCVVFRQSDNYVQHTNGTKFLYPYLSGTGRPFEFSMAAANGREGGTFRWRMETYYVNNASMPKVLTDNVTPITMTRGTWYRLEFSIENNLVPGQATGRIRWWTSTWNGSEWSAPVLNANYTNMNIVPDGFNLPGTWGLWQYNLYYGGSGDNLVSADQFIDLNRVMFFTAP
jgi:hypothetical protein